MGAPAMAEYQSQTILIIQQAKKGSSSVYDKNENPTSNDFTFFIGNGSVLGQLQEICRVFS
jgi:hypothetical protein